MNYREGRAKRGGDTKARELQRTAEEHPARTVPLLQNRRRDFRNVSRHVSISLPTRVCVGGDERVLWSTGDNIQVQALGVLRGTFQRPCSHWGDGSVLWNWGHEG
ncbi:hypothetical protein LINPERPRIM_LOCUS26700 [Linum perenne]